MNDLNDFLKAIAEAKAQDPKHQKIKEIKENAKEDLSSLFGQLSEIKKSDPKQKIIDKVRESVAGDIGNLFSQLNSVAAQVEEHQEPIDVPVEQIEEIEELVEQVEFLEEVAPVAEVVETPTVEETKTNIEKYAAALPKEEPSFQQPEVPSVSPELKRITDKLKFLEQWVGKISAAGPGGGEVNLRWLDDIDRSTIGDGKYLNYNATTKKFQFSTLSGGGAPQVQSDWTEADNTEPSFIKNKPTLFSGDYGDLTNKPTIPAAQVNSDWNASSGVAQILNKPTIPAAQIQSDWNQTNNAALDYIKNKPTIPDVTHIDDLLAATGEPMGHENKSQSTISFNANTQVFTIAPTGSEFHVWVKGTKYTYTTAQTVTLPNTSGLYYIYFDENGIGYQTSFYTWDSQAMTAYVYFNAVSTRGYLFDERHGITLDWQTHEFLHRTHGALYSSGFDVSNYSLMGDGSSNAHCTLDLSGGTFFDEDNQIDIVHSNTPTANTFEQDLVGPAQIPIFYKEDGGVWKLDTATNYPMKLGTDRPRYNTNSGGTWTTADIDNNKFGVTFIVATNMINTPIIGILGQSARDNIGAAESYNLSDLDLTGFPIVEMRQLYRVCYECKTSYTNTPSARITSIWDLRVTTTASTNVTTGDHGSLTGLLDDDHPQYLLRTDAASTYATPSDVTTAITNLIGAAPAALDTLKEIADQLATDESAVSSLTTTVAGKVSLTGSYANPDWITSLAYSKLTGTPTIPTVPTTVSSFTNDSGYLTSVSWSQVSGKPTLATVATSGSYTDLTNKPTIPTVPTNISAFTNDSGYLTSAAAGSLTGTTLNSTVVSSSLTSVGTLSSLNVTNNIASTSGSVTANAATAFIAGAAAESGVALQMPREGALRNMTNGANTMYFDVSNGGTTHGNFNFRSSSNFTSLLHLSSVKATINPAMEVNAQTPYVGRTSFNAALDTVVTVDNLKYRISNQGGVFPQIASASGSQVDVCYDVEGIINGATNPTYANNSGYLLAANGTWLSIYSSHGMDSRSDRLTAHITDKAAGKIYRVTYMKTNNSGNADGYNIIVERLL